MWSAHLGVHGTYLFLLLELPGGLRDLTPQTMTTDMSCRRGRPTRAHDEACEEIEEWAATIAEWYSIIRPGPDDARAAGHAAADLRLRRGRRLKWRYGVFLNRAVPVADPYPWKATNETAHGCRP
jgi:hypothetical protein